MRWFKKIQRPLQTVPIVKEVHAVSLAVARKISLDHILRCDLEYSTEFKRLSRTLVLDINECILNPGMVLKVEVSLDTKMIYIDDNLRTNAHDINIINMLSTYIQKEFAEYIVDVITTSPTELKLYISWSLD